MTAALVFHSTEVIAGQPSTTNSPRSFIALTPTTDSRTASTPHSRITPVSVRQAPANMVVSTGSIAIQLAQVRVVTSWCTPTIQISPTSVRWGAHRGAVGYSSVTIIVPVRFGWSMFGPKSILAWDRKISSIASLGPLLLRSPPTTPMYSIRRVI